MRSAAPPSKPIKVSTVHLFGFIFRTACFCTVCQEKVAAATTVAGKDVEDIGVCVANIALLLRMTRYVFFTEMLCILLVSFSFCYIEAGF